MTFCPWLDRRQAVLDALNEAISVIRAGRRLGRHERKIDVQARATLGSPLADLFTILVFIAAVNGHTTDELVASMLYDGLLMAVENVVEYVGDEALPAELAEMLAAVGLVRSSYPDRSVRVYN